MLVSQEENAVLNNSLGTLCINDNTFLISQPTRQHIFSFWRYCRNLARQSFNIKDKISQLEGVPEEVRKPLINALIFESKAEPTSALIWDTMSSPQGVAFLLYLLAKDNQEVKLELINNLITEENVDSVLIELEDACGFRIITENLNTDPPKNPTTPK